MHSSKHNYLIAFVRVIAWFEIVACTLMFVLLLIGKIGADENVSGYFIIIFAGILSGILFLGFAALLDHQANIEQGQQDQKKILNEQSKILNEQSKILKAILESTKSTNNTPDNAAED